MKKGIVAGLIVLCVALGAGTAAVVVTDDRKGPEIELPADGDVTYEEGSDTAPLLEGVTATDEKDGDVTDSLVIENIFPNDDHTSASVVYAAKDSHNNVSKATRRVNYKAAAEDTPAENEATQETDNSGAADESAPAAEEPQEEGAYGMKHNADGTVTFYVYANEAEAAPLVFFGYNKTNPQLWQLSGAVMEKTGSKAGYYTFTTAEKVSSGTSVSYMFGYTPFGETGRRDSAMNTEIVK